jgi:methyltransferase (TIGR00027 family)
MLTDQPSRTQLRTAIRRATHQILDRHIIPHDPIALQMVPEAADPSVVAQLQSDGAPDLVLLRTLFAIRSRFAEDRLAEASRRDVEQYVVLGAGLDTFPWRQPPFARRMRVIIVDHPASLPFAFARFRAAGLNIPENTSYTPIDLEHDCLLKHLDQCGIYPGKPAIVSMLGVSQYLAATALDRVIQFVAKLPVASELVVSIALPADQLDGSDLRASLRSAHFTASIGEPWITWVSPADLQSRLQEPGFRTIFHLTPDRARELYMTPNGTVPAWEQMIAATV